MKSAFKKSLVLLMVSACLTGGCGKDAVTAPPETENVTANNEQGTADTGEVNDAQQDSFASDDTDSAISTTETPDSPAAETEEETEVSAAEDDADSPSADRDLFADFIMGKTGADVSDRYYSEIRLVDDILKSGSSYSVNDIKDQLSQDEMISQTQPVLSYAPVWCHDCHLYALQLYYETDREALSLVYILYEHDGKLEYVFGIDGWSRRHIFVNEYGIITDDGSNGAGSHSYVAYAPDATGVYQTIYDVDEEYYGFSFGDPDAPIEAVMKEAGDDIIYYKEIIDGKTFYYFLGQNKLTQSTVDEIDRIAASHNFKFDGKAAADEAREAYQQQLDITDAVKSETGAHWKEL